MHTVGLDLPSYKNIHLVVHACILYYAFLGHPKMLECLGPEKPTSISFLNFVNTCFERIWHRGVEGNATIFFYSWRVTLNIMLYSCRRQAF